MSSVSAQKNYLFEHIVIDGLSTDGTIDIINEYKDNIDVFVSESDLGIYDALNKGIKYCSGKYIGILHSDDILHPKCFKSLLNAYRKSPNNDIYSGHLISKSFNSLDKQKEIKPIPLKYSAFKMPLPHPACFIKQKLFSSYGLYRLDLGTCADYELILRFLKKKPSIEFLDFPISYFSLDGISSTQPPPLHNIAYILFIHQYNPLIIFLALFVRIFLYAKKLLTYD